jgi:hypothetical protein
MKETKLNVDGAQAVLAMVINIIFQLPSICEALGLTLPDFYDKGRTGVLMGINIRLPGETGEGNTATFAYKKDLSIDNDHGLKWNKHSKFVIQKIRFLIVNPGHVSSYMVKIFQHENVLGGVRLINGWILAISGRVKEIDELIAVLWQHFYFANSMATTLAYAKTLYDFGCKKNVWLSDDYLQPIIEYINESHYIED